MSDTAPSPEETLLIGTLVGSFGLRGQVKMRAITNNPEHLRRIRTVYLGPGRKPYPLQRVQQPKPGTLVLTLGGVESRSAADDLRGSEVAILERDAAPLDEGEYFIHQLYGLDVVDEQGAPIGRVREVLETGANDVLVITRPGKSDGLIPMIRDVIRELDVAAGRITVRPLEGMLD